MNRRFIYILSREDLLLMEWGREGVVKEKSIIMVQDSIMSLLTSQGMVTQDLRNSGYLRLEEQKEAFFFHPLNQELNFEILQESLSMAEGLVYISFD